LPAWSACTVQVPGATNETVAPFAPPDVQTAGVVALNATGRWEVAVAPTVKGDWRSVLLAGALKVIVWFAGAMLKAALHVTSPFIVTTPSRQSASPAQPSKLEPPAAVAVNVTTVPATYDPEQSPPQLMPPGLLVTVPLPPPDLVTLRTGPTTQDGSEIVET
jgi:hypothetical protein